MTNPYKLAKKLPITDAGNAVRLALALIEKWPQINEATKIEMINRDFIEVAEVLDLALEVSSIGMASTRCIADIKDELRRNLGQVINDRNYLIKLLREYTREEMNSFVKRIYQLEILGCNSGYGRPEYLESVYIPQLDTLVIRSER